MLIPSYYKNTSLPLSINHKTEFKNELNHEESPPHATTIYLSFTTAIEIDKS